MSVWIGAEIGATAAFFLGRFIVRKPIQSKIAKIKVFNAIDKVIGQQVRLQFLTDLGTQAQYLAQTLPIDPIQPVQLWHGCHCSQDL